MSDDAKIKSFVVDIRRTLYLSKLFLYNLDWMKSSELCPTYMKGDISNITNSIHRLLNDMMCKDPQRWEKVKIDLSKDKLYDLLLLIDCMADIDNIAEITEVIQSCKTEVKTV